MFKLTTVTIAQYPSGEGLKYSDRPTVGEPNGGQVVVERLGKLYFALSGEVGALGRFGFHAPKAGMLDAYRLWQASFKFVDEEFVHEVENQADLRELQGLLNFRIERALSQLNWE